MIKVPFYKPSITQAEIDEVVDTLKSGWLTTGPKTKQFERDFGTYVQQKLAVGVNSCTAALHLALEAIGVHAGEGVLVPTMTFAATAEVVRYFNGVPILVDCRESDFNMDVADAERQLKAAEARGVKVVAMIPVHYGGQIGDVNGYTALAKKYGLKIVEDAAHCCPAFFRYDSSSEWMPAGASADISCFSFYANKCITTGEGGMACTQNDEYADRMRIMSLHGISRDAWKRFTAEGSWYYEIIAPGFKYNLTDIASAIGLHQLKRSDELHRKRTALAERYTEKLRDIDELVLPTVQPDRIHSWHLYGLRLMLEKLTVTRNDFIEHLKKAGIGTSVHYTPLHMHPYYREKFGYKHEDMPTMSRMYPEIVTLPLFPDMTEGDVDAICGVIRSLIAANRR